MFIADTNVLVAQVAVSVRCLLLCFVNYKTDVGNCNDVFILRSWFYNQMI